MPAVATSALCVAAVVAGLLLATGAAVPAVALAASGHWVVNAAENAVVHVDGGTAQVDARVELPPEAGGALFALEGERQGFVVARERVTVFGRSTLTVDTSFPVDFAEEPVGIETVGGPYLVYRAAGTVVRLGVPPLSLPVGGPVGRPVWTDDGTVWLQRTDDGSFCAVRSGADDLDCSAGSAPGEPGGLTVTGADAAFVGTRLDAAQVLAPAGAPVGLGADVAEAGLLADRDTGGRLAVVEPDVNRLVLTDSAGIPSGRAGGAAIPVDLGPGRFSAPLAASGVIAVLDVATNRLLTFDPSGTPLGTTQLPPGEPPTLTRGLDGRLYVDDATGASTHVVGPDGGVTSVTTGGPLPETVAVAAPPQRRSPVLPPPTVRGPSVPSPVGGSPLAPPPGPPAATPPGPPAQVVGPPPAPAGVTARAEGTSVVVSWQPVPGGAATYEVQSGTGARLPVAGTSATFTGLPVGVSISFIVRATVAGVTGPPSPPVATVIPGGPAAPPTGFTARVTPASGASPFVLTWQRPDLRGGTLVGYEVSATDRLGNAVALTANGERIEGDLLNCEAPYTVEINAITRLPGGAGTLAGERGSTTVDNGVDCSMTSRITAAADGPDQVTVTAEIVGGGDAFVGGDCALEFDGTVRWTGTCSPRSFGPATVDGLAPGTSYSVQLTISVPGHGTTTSNTVTVTTEAGAPKTGDLDGDGFVGCADQEILESQWQQTGPGLSADLNDDEIVDITDQSILLSNWDGGGGGTC